MKDPFLLILASAARSPTRCGRATAGPHSAPDGGPGGAGPGVWTAGPAFGPRHRRSEGNVKRRI